MKPGLRHPGATQAMGGPSPPPHPTRTPSTRPPRCPSAPPTHQVETLSEPAAQASPYCVLPIAVGRRDIETVCKRFSLLPFFFAKKKGRRPPGRIPAPVSDHRRHKTRQPRIRSQHPHPAPSSQRLIPAPSHAPEKGPDQPPGTCCIHSASCCAGASPACSPATTPATSAALRFWLNLYLPSSAVSGISMQTMARSIAAM